MTVIFGVNLSDRLYIAGDSRLSRLVSREGQEIIEVVHDNMQKVEPLKGSSGVVIASAGNANFAKYILKSLASQPFLRGGIVSVRAEIEDWVRQATDQYLSKGNSISEMHAAFIIGGADKHSKKVIHGKDLLPLIKAYGGKEDGNSGHLKKVIADGLMSKGIDVPNPDPELPVNNTILFGLVISSKGIDVVDTKWGEYLIYGPPGLKKDDVPTSFVGNLEFDEKSGDVQHDISITVGLIHTLADTRALASVGGVVVTMMVASDQSIVIMEGDIYSWKDGESSAKLINRLKTAMGSRRLYRLESDGSLRKLIPVSEYTASGRQGYFL